MHIDGFFKIDHKCKQNQGSGSSWIIKKKVPRCLNAAPLNTKTMCLITKLL